MAQIANENIGFKGGTYKAIARGNNCLAFVPTKTYNNCCIVNISGGDNMGLDVYISGYGDIQYTNLDNYSSLIIPYPELSANDFTDNPLMSRRIVIQPEVNTIEEVFKLDFSNVNVTDTLKLGSWYTKRCELTLPSNKPQYLGLMNIKGTLSGEYSTLDLREYVCYTLETLNYNDIKIGVMGTPKKGDNVIVTIEGLNNVTEFGGLESDVTEVDIHYCSDETILSILRGINGANGPNGKVDVYISLRVDQTITDEMRNIATQNSIELNY